MEIKRVFQLRLALYSAYNQQCLLQCYQRIPKIVVKMNVTKQIVLSVSDENFYDCRVMRYAYLHEYKGKSLK